MFIGVVTDLASTQGPLFTCEQVALDKLVSGLVEPCVCGHVKWETCSQKQGSSIVCGKICMSVLPL